MKVHVSICGIVLTGSVIGSNFLAITNTAPIDFVTVSLGRKEMSA